MFLVIVASHIRPRAMIIASFTSMLRISVKDCDHRSQPDVWGNNDRKHRIKPLNNNNYPEWQLTFLARKETQREYLNKLLKRFWPTTDNTRLLTVTHTNNQAYRYDLMRTGMPSLKPPLARWLKPYSKVRNEAMTLTCYTYTLTSITIWNKMSKWDKYQCLFWLC